jgi:WD40 repeat protein
MDFDVSSTLLATGSSDMTIKLWDIDKQYCTHNLKGHTGVIRYSRTLTLSRCSAKITGVSIIIKTFKSVKECFI